MQNRLWKDLTDRLAQEPFKGIYGGWGPQWVTFIKIDSPITVDKPLWTQEESSLDTIQLFNLTPDQLQLEIICYWKQPFWKRWLFSLFTSINLKIKLWSYYHRCIAVRTASLENMYRIDIPIDSEVEQHGGQEMIQRLYQTTLKLTDYTEKYAGNLTFKKNDKSLDFYVRKNWKLFDKLMEKKIALVIENKDELQERLSEEFERHKMMLLTYLVAWQKRIFDEPIYFDKLILLDTYVDRTGKKVTVASQSIKEWVKLKQHILQLMLQDNSPGQFNHIKNFLEIALSRIDQVFSQQLKRFEQLITKVKCDRFAANKAIEQANILQKNFFLLKKSVLLFHPDKSFGNVKLQAIQTELFKHFNGLVNESIEKIEQGLQTLEKCLITQKNKLAFYKMRNSFFFRIIELERIRQELNRKLDAVDDEIHDNKECQAMKEKLWRTEAEIEGANFRYCNYHHFIKRPRTPIAHASLKLFFEPLSNPRQDEQKEENYGTYEEKKTPWIKSSLPRYTPVF